MFKLWATIKKDFRILTRDKVGLTLMFLMPVLLVLVITAVQNSTFELVNNNKISLLLNNEDTGAIARQLQTAIEEAGIFEVNLLQGHYTDKEISGKMYAKDAMVSIVIPPGFSSQINNKAQHITQKALQDFGVSELPDSAGTSSILEGITLYYHPVLQESFRKSIVGTLQSALQIVESRQILNALYYSLNNEPLPEEMEKEIISNKSSIKEVSVSRNGSRNIPNATQHNIPAWTIFAMFFIVISLGSSVVREKLSGSFIRLKTLPTNYTTALLSKQITYLGVSLLQVAVIFSMGIWLFPYIGLPQLNIPADLGGLFLVSVICGWCAVSYAIAVGVFATTQEQANGFGAVSIIILAAVGGILVPAFAMPSSFKIIMQLSPLHWCLEAYYGLFLEGGNLKDILLNLLPLLLLIAVIHLLIYWQLKRKKYI